MRGYFGVGAERISKPMNLGAILRTAHAFGASFAFSVNAHHAVREVRRADTAHSQNHVPYYEWASLTDMALPRGCALVGVELTDDAAELPRFRHPQTAAYLFGPEKGDLSAEALGRCTHVVKIPTRFCVNLSVAAAIVMYDRALALGARGARTAQPRLRPHVGAGRGRPPRQLS